MGHSIAGLILAAGEGRRFGGAKQLAEVDGEPLIALAYQRMQAVTGPETYVVLGARADEIKQAIPDAITFVHDNWISGLGTSIAFGISQILKTPGPAANGILISLADQPSIQTADLERLVEAYDGSKIVTAFYDDAPGVPAVFPPEDYTSLLTLSGDHGAKAIMLAKGERLLGIPMPGAALDIDRPEDIKRIEKPTP